MADHILFNISAIMGKAGSGKDTLQNELVKQIPNSFPIISCTTRPIRDNEQDGVNYHYLTVEQFTDQLLNNEMLESTEFNNWFYGTSFKNLSTTGLNIGVYNPTGVEILRADPRINLTVIYLMANDKVRLLRQLNREENPDCHEIIRRFSADEEDFTEDRLYDIIQPDFWINNNGDCSIQDIAKMIALTLC
jgi:guanylate kinase